MKKKCLAHLILGVFLFYLFPATFQGLELDPFPVFDISRDPFSITFFREERPSFYWVNIGVPDLFFNGVQQLSGQPNPTVYSIRSIEYGVQARGWVSDQLQLRAVFPFEANALVDPTGNTHNVAKFGDMELGATYLLTGKREKGNFVGLDGWYRFATGTNPFKMDYPLLSTGKGTPEEAVGVVMAEEVSGFSFFQSIHYQKTQSLLLDSSNPFLGAGTFQWPDNIFAQARVEYLVFQRAQRFVSVYVEGNIRMSGLMEFNSQVLPYGHDQTTDQLFFQTYGLVVRVDKAFSAEGKVSWFPSEIKGNRPDYGTLFSLAVVFRPI